MMNSDSHDHTQVAENFYHEKVFKCKECDEVRSSKKAMKKHLKRSGHSGFTVDSGFPVVEEKQHVLPEQPPLDHNLPVTTGGKVLLNEMAFFMGMRKYANATAGQYSRMAKNSLIPHFESYYSEGKFVMDSLLWALDASVTMPPLSTYIDQLADTSKCKVAIQAYKVLCHTVQHVVHKR